jgi:hypothetical protein
LLRILETGADDGEIALYGIDLAQHTEYVAERPCVEFWLGVAVAAGVKVTIPPTSDILKCVGMYGVDEGASDLEVKLRARLVELNEREVEMAQQWETLRSQMELTRYHQHAISGAKENTAYILQNWLQQPGDVRQGGEDPYSTQAAEPAPVEP